MPPAGNSNSGMEEMKDELVRYIDLNIEDLEERIEKVHAG
jgi:hypothetical protein